VLGHRLVRAARLGGAATRTASRHRGGRRPACGAHRRGDADTDPDQHHPSVDRYGSSAMTSPSTRTRSRARPRTCAICGFRPRQIGSPPKRARRTARRSVLRSARGTRWRCRRGRRCDTGATRPISSSRPCGMDGRLRPARTVPGAGAFLVLAAAVAGVQAALVLTCVSRAGVTPRLLRRRSSYSRDLGR
jgi:hypothetical protein